MDPGLLAVLRLSKEGFGTPIEILHMPVSVVLGALDYCQFQQKYEEAYIELNKPSKNQ